MTADKYPQINILHQVAGLSYLLAEVLHYKQILLQFC